ncbi:MAG TPA: rod shape-determining protein MreD [Nevskiaceae bacterium]|nr:rod shape-determining protein MreD [Nevskiaceae bacterium]
MRRPPHGVFWASGLVALVLQLMALPDAVAAARPLWLPVVIAYWALTEPRVPALLGALLFGLCSDILFDNALGQHAAALVVVAYLVTRLRGIFVLFPLWQATFALAPVWALYAFLMFWMDGVTRHQADPWLRWLPVLATSLLWPLAFTVLDRLARRRRQED